MHLPFMHILFVPARHRVPSTTYSFDSNVMLLFATERHDNLHGFSS